MAAEVPAIAASPGPRVDTRVAICLVSFCLVYGFALAFYPVPCLVGLAALLVVVFLWLRPELALPLALFVVPLDLLGHVTADGSITVAKLLILLAGLIWAIRILLLRDQYPIRVLLHPVSLLMIAFLAANVASFVNARQLGPAVIFLHRRCNVVAFALLVAVLLRDRRSWDRALAYMTVASLPVALFGLYELITGEAILSLVSYRSQDELKLLAGESWRIHGTFDDGPFHAIYVVSAMSLCLCWILRTRSRALQAALGGLLLLLLVNLVGTASRGGALGLGVVLLVFWIGLGARYKRLLAGGLVVTVVAILLVALLLPQVPLHRYTQISPETDPTTQIRLGLYSVGLGMIADHPVLGVGTGNWVRNYHRYATAGTFRSITFMPHNTYLQIAAENGLFGLVVYLGLLAAAAYQFVLALRRTPHRDERLPVLAAMGAFLAFAVFATTSNVLENETYWAFLGFSIVVSCLPASRSEEPVGGG